MQLQNFRQSIRQELGPINNKSGEVIEIIRKSRRFIPIIKNMTLPEGDYQGYRNSILALIWY